MQTHRVTIITIPLCPKCLIMKQRLKKIQQSNPDLIIEEKGIQTYLDEAIKKRILDAPIILINERVYTGVLDEATILAALEL